ncbi:hypothetical protein ACTFIW_003312 [Dictyostelium discoideum]
MSSILHTGWYFDSSGEMRTYPESGTYNWEIKINKCYSIAVDEGYIREYTATKKDIALLLSFNPPVDNIQASISGTSASNKTESFDLRMQSMDDQINNLALAFVRFMKKLMFSSNTNSCSQCTHGDSETKNEQSNDESSNNVDVPTDYQLSETLLGQYKHMVNDQGLLIEEECILKKDEISESNKVFNFPSYFQVNAKISVKSSGNNTTGNSSNSKSSRGSNYRSNNFNGSPSNFTSGSSKLLARGRNRIVKHLHQQPIIQDGRNQESTMNANKVTTCKNSIPKKPTSWSLYQIHERTYASLIPIHTEQSDDESSNNVDVPTDYQLSDILTWSVQTSNKVFSTFHQTSK